MPEQGGYHPDPIRADRSGSGQSGHAPSVVESLKAHLMEAARNRTIEKVAAGGRFCAVMLDDGGTGAVNICRDGCRHGEPSSTNENWLPEPGTCAADVLAGLGLPARSAAALATANAMSNKSARQGGRLDEMSVGTDLLDVLELRADDHVGMVGCFSPLLDRLRGRIRQLSIFERAPRLAPPLLPEDRAPEILPDCSVAMITATTMMNGTIDMLLAAAAPCREVVLLGPSTPLVPAVFTDTPHRVTLLAGVVVTDSAGLLQTVANHGGGRDFKAHVAKVNLRP